MSDSMPERKVDLRAHNPKGRGEIIDWDTNYCIRCKTGFKSKAELFNHIKFSRHHLRRRYMGNHDIREWIK
jgi:hypothetical protein